MKPVIIFLTLFTLASMGASAQTTKEMLEKVKADPKTKERAAKADVYIAKQTSVIADTTSTRVITTDKSPGTKKKQKRNSK
ncbi:MAG TPA: hypothetical protein VEV87_09350 [Chitinophagaceae bacterium]|nr:hypothetical protein [Chitinophagaceae bacterium]